MTRQNGKRARPGGLWLLLVPVTCCGGPLLVAGLAAAGAVAWGGRGAALAAAAAITMLVVRQRRRTRVAARPDRAAGLSDADCPGDPGRMTTGDYTAADAASGGAGPGLAAGGR